MLLTPEQNRKTFKANPDTLDLLALVIADLFIFGKTPEQQARANKAREVLIELDVLKYPEEFGGITPSIESVKELLRKIL